MKPDISTVYSLMKPDISTGARESRNCQAALPASLPAWAGVGDFQLGPAGLKPPVSLRWRRAVERAAAAPERVVTVWVTLGAVCRERIPVSGQREGVGSRRKISEERHPPFQALD